MFTGDEIIDAWTPDGRPAGKQPRRVIGALGLSTQPPGVPDAMPGLDSVIAPPSTGPAMPVAPMAGGMAPGVLPTPAQPNPQRPPLPTSDVAGPTAHSPQAGSPVGTGGASSPSAGGAAAPNPVTNADLSKMGTAGGYNAQAQASADQEAAATNTAEKEADALIKKANAEDERNVAINAALVKRQQDAEANLKRINDKTTALSTAREKWANTKIDRSTDHPVLAAIAVAMGAIGSAMAGNKDGSNPGLDAVFKSLDRKVAGQMQDLDKAGKALDMRKEEIGELRTHASDQIAMHNLAISAESEKAARHVEALMSRSNSEIVKSKGAELAAGIRARGADALASAIDRQLGVEDKARTFEEQKRQHKASINVQYAGLAQSDRHHKERMTEDARQFDAKLVADQNAAVAAARAQGNAAAQKEFSEYEKLNRENGINDVASGKPILQPEGQKMFAEADAVEAEAAKLRAGATGAGGFLAKQRADMLERKASQLRGEATLRHTWRAADPVEAREVKKLIANTQTAIGLTDDIKAAYENGGKSWVGSSDAEKRMKSLAAQLDLNMKDIFEMGALDAGAERYMNKLTGGDPSKVNVNTFTGMLGNSDNPDAFMNAVAEKLADRAANRAKVAGYQGVLKFTRKAPETISEAKAAGDKIRAGKTSAEQEEGTEAGLGRRIAENAIPVVGNIMESNRKGAAASASSDFSTTYPGFAKSQEKAVGNLVALYQAGGKARAQAEPVLLGMVQDKNPNIQTAALRTIKEHMPDLYATALARLPEADRKIQLDIERGKKSVMDVSRR